MVSEISLAVNLCAGAKMMVVSVLKFAADTCVLLISGCVSLITVSGLCGGVGFLLYNHLKYERPDKKSLADSYGDEVDVCDEPVSSQPESSKQIEQRVLRVKSNECSRPEILRTLRDYLQITVASTTASNYDKDGEIREFLEHLVGTLISENLDDVPLTPLSNDEQYAEIFTRYHSKLSSILTILSASLHSNKDSESLDDDVRPSTLYGQLQSVIQEVQKEASLLPPLANYDAEFGPASIETCLEGQSYEDILTTAVLNKIVSRSQNKETYTSRKINIADLVNGVGSGWNSSRKKEYSLLIEERIEEVTTRYISKDETDSIIETSNNVNLITKHRAQFPELGKDIVDVGYNSDEDGVTEMVTDVDSWEDNWLFQRKKKNKMKSTVSQISVPMLVPNPSENYRALIGGIDVDETSDLSECSDSFIEDIIDIISTDETNPTKTNYIYKYDFNSSLETPTFKNDVDNESEGFDQDSSGVTSISRDLSDVYSFSSISPYRSDEESMSWTGVREAKNEHLLLAQVDSGEGSLDTQPENEYLNHDEICETSAAEEPSTCETFNVHANTKILENNDSESSLVQDLATPPKPGTIAEREHQKWEQAKSIPNNPYSKENLEKRKLDSFLPKTCVISTISNQYERNKFDNTINGAVPMNDITKYERDYYVNGDKSKSEEITKVEQRTKSVTREEKTSSQNGFVKMPDTKSSSDKRTPNLVRVSSWSDRKKPSVEIRKRLPSVKELAKQFSEPNNVFEEKDMFASKNQMVHSLTARSMSREFREGLKNNVNKIYNRNILANGKDEYDNEENLI